VERDELKWAWDLGMNKGIESWLRIQKNKRIQRTKEYKLARDESNN
jgi:hypothetical protein